MNDQDFQTLVTQLSSVSTEEVDEDEVRLILRRYPDVDALHQTHRFVRWWEGHRSEFMHSLAPWERMLDKAKPTANRQNATAATPIDERWRAREAKIRRSLSQCTYPILSTWDDPIDQGGTGECLDGQPLFDEEIEEAVAYFRAKFYESVR